MTQLNSASAWNRRIEGKTAVYRLYDATDRLLYVGISTTPERRWGEHANEKLWWHWVSRRDVAWFESRAEALAVEAEAERREKPRFGDTHRLGDGWRSSERKTDPELLKEIEQVTAQLRSAILRGEYRREGCLPTHRRLSEQYGVSKPMVGQAIRRLHEEGLLRSVTERAAIAPWSKQ